MFHFDIQREQMDLINYGLNFSEGQIKELAKAVRDKTAAKVKLQADQLRGAQEMLLNSAHLKKIQNALKSGRGCTLAFTPSHLKKMEKTGNGIPKFMMGIANAAIGLIAKQGAKDVQEMIRVFKGKGIDLTIEEVDMLYRILEKMGMMKSEGGAVMPKSARMMSNALAPGIGSLVGFISDKIKGKGLFVPGAPTGGCCEANVGDIGIYAGDGLWLPGTVGVYNQGNGFVDIGEFMDEAIGKAKDAVSGEAKKAVKRGRKKVEKAVAFASDLPDWMSKKKA